MKRFELSKVIHYALVAAMAFAIPFGLGLYSAAHRTLVFRMIDDAQRSVSAAVTTVTQEMTTMTGLRPRHFLQPARHSGAGVTVNAAPAGSDDLILLSGFFENTNELRLIRRDGSIVARWPVAFSTIFPDVSHLRHPPTTDWNIDLHGALMLPDGSVVFNFEHGGLVKLDRCGGVVWTLARQTHHSVERASGGGFWVPARRYRETDGPPPFPPFPTSFAEDVILKVSEDGKVVSETSVVKLFYDNGLAALLTSTGQNFLRNMPWDHEIVHLNKIEPLKPAWAAHFPTFSAGDLALSLRKLNMLLVVDPETWQIEWWQIGPWVRQHDPEFTPDGNILVFDNNVYRLALKPDGETSDPRYPRVSEIDEIDPATGAYKVVYGGRRGQKLLSVIRGKVDPTPGGGLFITEPEGGRVIETDASGRKIWEYVNRYDEDEVAEISEARLYPARYVTVKDWSCEGRGR